MIEGISNLLPGLFPEVIFPALNPRCIRKFFFDCLLRGYAQIERRSVPIQTWGYDRIEPEFYPIILRHPLYFIEFVPVQRHENGFESHIDLVVKESLDAGQTPVKRPRDARDLFVRSGGCAIEGDLYGLGGRSSKSSKILSVITVPLVKTVTNSPLFFARQ